MITRNWNNGSVLWPLLTTEISNRNVGQGQEITIMNEKKMEVITLNFALTKYVTMFILYERKWMKWTQELFCTQPIPIANFKFLKCVVACSMVASNIGDMHNFQVIACHWATLHIPLQKNDACSLEHHMNLDAYATLLLSGVII